MLRNDHIFQLSDEKEPFVSRREFVLRSEREANNGNTRSSRVSSGREPLQCGGYIWIIRLPSLPPPSSLSLRLSRVPYRSSLMP